MDSMETILGGGTTAPEGKTTETEQVTQTATEGASQTEQATESTSTEGDGDSGQTMVPVAALQGERAKVKRYTEEVADFRKALTETNAAFERRMAQLVEAITPKQAPPAPPDFFENPQAATRHEVTEAVSPEFERINQALHSFARDQAIDRFSEEKVNGAEQAFLSALRAGQLDPADYRRIVGSTNRYAESVRWHERQQARAEIGDDPAAYKTKLEAEIREKVLAEINGGTSGQQQQAAAVRPSNLAGARNVGARSGPAWSGPSTLQDIFDRRPLNG